MGARIPTKNLLDSAPRLVSHLASFVWARGPRAAMHRGPCDARDVRAREFALRSAWQAEKRVASGGFPVFLVPLQKGHPTGKKTNARWWLAAL